MQKHIYCLPKMSRIISQSPGNLQMSSGIKEDEQSPSDWKPEVYEDRMCEQERCL